MQSVLPVTGVFLFGDSATRLKGVRGYDAQIEVRAGGSHLSTRRRADMPKKARKSDSGVYRVTEIIGTSTVSWEDAASSAVAAAAKSLRDLRVAEVSKLDMKVENGKVVAYRARVSLSFKYEA
jgi:flavin-binding protein dodecin